MYTYFNHQIRTNSKNCTASIYEPVHHECFADLIFIVVSYEIVII
jgi:hypothetical protein